MKLVALNTLAYLLVLVGNMSLVRADDQTTSAPISESKPAVTAPATWSFGLGVGTGAITGSGDEEFSQGVSSTLQLGYRLTSKQRLQLDGGYTSFARFQMDPTKSQQQSAVTLGARWAPFEPEERRKVSHIDLSALYLKGGLGVGHLTRTPYDTINPLSVDHGKWGGAVTSGLGWTPVRGPGYEFGIEGSGSVVFYRDEVRHNIGLNLIVNVDLF